MNQPIDDRQPLGTIPLVLLLGLFLWLAVDGRHYWHEARFLFLTERFSLAESVSGRFNPHQVGGSIDELESSGFYASKLLHLAGLELLFGILPASQGGWSLAVALSVGLVLLALALFSATLRRIEPRGPPPELFLAAGLLMPSAAYLAGKLLSEVTALPAVALTLYGLTRSLSSAGRKAILWSGISALGLLLTALGRLDMTLCFAAFVAASWILPPGDSARMVLARRAGTVAALATAAYLALAPLFGIRLGALWRYLVVYVELESKSHLMSALGLVGFGGVLYVAAGAALLRRAPGASFFALWAALAAAPMILVTANYMIEPRYLAPALLPLAALAACGMPRLTSGRSGALVAAGVALVVFGAHGFLNSLMPYELDRPALERAVRATADHDPQAAILLPWAYTDYHWLSVMHPQRAIYDVYAPADGLQQGFRTRFRQWYGAAWLEDREALDRVFAEGQPVFYLGWRRYPPVAGLARRARALGLSPLAEKLDELPLQDHLVDSWIWRDPTLRLELVDTFGQYELRRLTLR